MIKITNNKIHLTRGDTASIDVVLYDNNGDEYTPEEGDTIKFRLKQDPYAETILLEKTVDTESMILLIEESETAELSFGTYYYEIELITSNDYHYTAIANAQFIVGVELENHA